MRSTSSQTFNKIPRQSVWKVTTASSAFSTLGTAIPGGFFFPCSDSNCDGEIPVVTVSEIYFPSFRLSFQRIHGKLRLLVQSYHCKTRRDFIHFSEIQGFTISSLTFLFPPANDEGKQQTRQKSAAQDLCGIERAAFCLLGEHAYQATVQSHTNNCTFSCSTWSCWQAQLFKHLFYEQKRAH